MGYIILSDEELAARNSNLKDGSSSTRIEGNQPGLSLQGYSLQPAQGEDVSADTGTEGFGARTLRNIAKIPHGAYTMARSGMGLGNILETLGKMTDETRDQMPTEYQVGDQQIYGTPEEQKERRSWLLPTSEEAAGEHKWMMEKALPKHIADYLTEHREGDTPYEIVANALPFLAHAAATGGVGAIPRLMAAGKAAGTYAGVLGGSKIGRGGLGYIAEELAPDKPLVKELAEGVGELGGGVLGGIGARMAMNRPSKALKEPLHEADVAEFETAKEKRVAEVEAEYEPKIKEQTREAQAAELEVAETQKSFENTKKKQIKNIEKTKTKYDKNLEELNAKRKPLYDEATSVESNESVSAASLEHLQDMENYKLAGASKKDKAVLSGLIDDLQSNTKGKTVKRKGKKIKVGKMSPVKAKEIFHNANEQAHRYLKKGAAFKGVKRLTEALKEFINENSPAEHYEPWNEANEITTRYKALEKKKADFISEKNQQIKEIKAEKFDPVEKVLLKQESKRLYKEVKATEAERNAARKSVSKQTYEQAQKSAQDPNNQSDLTYIMSKVKSRPAFGIMASLLSHYLGFGMWGKVVSGIAGWSAKSLMGEAKLIKHAYKNHPTIFKNYTKLIADVPLLTRAQMTARVQNIQDDINDIAKENLT